MAPMSLACILQPKAPADSDSAESDRHNDDSEDEDVTWPDIFSSTEVQLCQDWGRWAESCQPDPEETKSASELTNDCELEVLRARHQSTTCQSAIDEHLRCQLSNRCENEADACSEQKARRTIECGESNDPSADSSGQEQSTGQTQDPPNAGEEPESPTDIDWLCQRVAETIIECYYDGYYGGYDEEDFVLSCLNAAEYWANVGPDCENAFEEWAVCMSQTNCFDLDAGDCQTEATRHELECG